MQIRIPHILCIDEDNDNCELIRAMLRFADADYEFTCAATPEEGLRLAAAGRFDLYLLDYRFAGMTGVELCRTLRRTDADTPVIFFTCEAYPRERQEGMEAGADAYLVKPGDLGKLTETVKQLLGARHPATRHIPPATLGVGASA